MVNGYLTQFTVPTAMTVSSKVYNFETYFSINYE